MRCRSEQDRARAGEPDFEQSEKDVLRSILNEIRLTTGSAVISALEKPWGGTKPPQLCDVTSAQYLTLRLVEDTFVPALCLFRK